METVALGRSKRATAGNRMRELLEKAHQQDEEELFKEEEGDDEFAAPVDQRDVFLEDFADTDDEVELGSSDEERALRREERKKAKGKSKAAYNPLAPTASSSTKIKSVKFPSEPTAVPTLPKDAHLLDPNIDPSLMAPSTLVLALRKKRREQKRLARDQVLRSTLRASTLKTEEEILERERQQKEGRPKGKRAQHETGQIKVVKRLTQDELIAAALEEEERNKEALRDWVRKEEERRELRRVGRKRVVGPRWTWVTRTVGKLVEEVEGGVEAAETKTGKGDVAESAGASAAVCPSKAGIAVDKVDGSDAAPKVTEDSPADPTPAATDIDDPSNSARDTSAPPLSRNTVSIEAEIVAATPVLDAPLSASPALPVEPISGSTTVDQVPPTIEGTPTATSTSATEIAPTADRKSVEATTPSAAEDPAPRPTASTPPTGPASAPATAPAPAQASAQRSSPAPVSAPEPASEPKSTAAPKSAPEPAPAPEGPAQYTRNYIILSEIPGGLAAELRLVLGDHVEWDQVKYIPHRNRPINRRPVICPFTGVQARYRHPQTNTPYATVEGYKQIQALLQHRYMWDEDTSVWYGGEEDMWADGVENVEGWAEAVHGGWMGGKEIDQSEAAIEEEVMEADNDAEIEMEAEADVEEEAAPASSKGKKRKAAGSVDAPAAKKAKAKTKAGKGKGKGRA